ncbi:MAG: response regulator [bacterium]|nr:response regulator [bacterium]
MRNIDPDVKVILSTGYSKDGQASGIIADGVSGFIQKPFRMNKLSQTISDVLKK